MEVATSDTLPADEASQQVVCNGFDSPEVDRSLVKATCEQEGDTSLSLKLQLDCTSNDSIPAGRIEGATCTKLTFNSPVTDANSAGVKFGLAEAVCTGIENESPNCPSKLADSFEKGSNESPVHLEAGMTSVKVNSVNDVSATSVVDSDSGLIRTESDTSQSGSNLVGDSSVTDPGSGVTPVSEKLQFDVIRNSDANSVNYNPAKVESKSVRDSVKTGVLKNSDTAAKGDILKGNDTDKENVLSVEANCVKSNSSALGPAIQKPKKQKARKSCHSVSPSVSETEVTSGRQTPSPITVSALTKKTIKVTELESVLGIKNRSLDTMDAKTLDMLVLQKAHQHIVRGETRGGRQSPPKLSPVRSLVHGSPNDKTPNLTPIKVTAELPSLDGDADCHDVTKASTLSTVIAGQNLLGRSKKRKAQRFKGVTYALPGSKNKARRGVGRWRRRRSNQSRDSCDSESIDTGGSVGDTGSQHEEPEELQQTLEDLEEDPTPFPGDEQKTPDKAISKEIKKEIRSKEKNSQEKKSKIKNNAVTANQPRIDSMFKRKPTNPITKVDNEISFVHRSRESLELMNVTTESIMDKSDTATEGPDTPLSKADTPPSKTDAPLKKTDSLAGKSDSHIKKGMKALKKKDTTSKDTENADNASGSEGKKKVKRRRKRKLAEEEDASSVTSTMTQSSSEEFVTDSLKPSVNAPKRRKIEKTKPTDAKCDISKTDHVASFDEEPASDPRQAAPRTDPEKKLPKQEAVTSLPSMPTPSDRAPTGYRPPAESDSSDEALRWHTSTPVKSGDFLHAPQAVKFVNTPNGLTYPVTPPQTPESAHSSQIGAEDRTAAVGERAKEGTALALCCCKVVGTTFANVKHSYCHALDSVDGKTMACFNKVTNSAMVRPSVRVPFMALCEVHRHRFTFHQCCPGCGQFCTQGVFIQCKMDKTSSAIHYFHKNCQLTRDDKYYCPHCGEQSVQREARVEAHTPRCLGFELAAGKERKPAAANARMGAGDGRRAEPDPGNDEDSVSVASSESKYKFSSKGMPPGPSKKDLQSLIQLFHKPDDASEKLGNKLRKGHKNLYQSCRAGDTERVLSLLLDEWDPNMKYEEHSKRTALHVAAERGHISIVHLLLQAGATPHAIDEELKTPLMYAVENCRSDVALLLAQSGVVMDFRASDGMTALHLAAKAGDLKSTKMIITTTKIDVNITDDGGWTPLIWAAEFKHLDVINYLMNVGSDPNVRDNEGNTGLHWACFSGSTEIAVVFLNAGCDIEASNEHGDRPLHIAARQGHMEVVSMLLARCADSLAKNNKNDTPSDCVIDTSSQLYMALQVNKQLKTVAAKVSRPEKLLHRDVSMGKEQYPIPIVNEYDDENYPTDYHYVADYVESSPMNVNRIVTSLQACECKDNCSTLYCNCGRNSVRCWYTEEGRLIDSFNYSDPPFVFECNRQCRCWTTCQNRVIQLGITVRLQVFRCPGKGWGVRPLLDVPKGSYVCEYIGELLSDAEADKREDDSYLFDLDNRDSDSFCIDARHYGNVSRFINHACDPNLIPVKVFVDHQDLRFPRICFFARRDIKAYEELGFDYCEKFWIIKYKQFTCECGAANCTYSSSTIHKTLEDYHKRQEETDSS